MQLILVAIVIFFPQTVTVFLDKEVKVDIDKVKIEMPAETTEPATTALPAASGASGPAGAASDPLKPPTEAETNAATDKAAADEQKKIDDLFAPKK